MTKLIKYNCKIRAISCEKKEISLVIQNLIYEFHSKHKFCKSFGTFFSGHGENDEEEEDESEESLDEEEEED